jgi:hypothetical protein
MLASARAGGLAADASPAPKFAVPHSDCCLLFAADFSGVFCSAFVFVAMRYA